MFLRRSLVCWEIVLPDPENERRDRIAAEPPLGAVAVEGDGISVSTTASGESDELTDPPAPEVSAAAAAVACCCCKAYTLQDIIR